MLLILYLIAKALGLEPGGLRPTRAFPDGSGLLWEPGGATDGAVLVVVAVLIIWAVMSIFSKGLR
jgi:hypothetical protein